MTVIDVMAQANSARDAEQVAARAPIQGRAQGGVALFRAQRAPYVPTWEWQKRRAAAVASGEAPETLVLVDHPPVYTMGRRTDPSHLLFDEAQLREAGAEAIWIDRGGDVTWHGPGQLVAYPILRLAERGKDLHAYVYALEETIMRVAASFGIAAQRAAGMTGVWVDHEKIAAIGIKLAHGWVTYHGLALNVSPDLRWFDRIVPCGLHGRGVSSLAAVLGRTINEEEVAGHLVREFEAVFGCRLSPSDGSLTGEIQSGELT